jgi:hypothetical protein
MSILSPKSSIENYTFNGKKLKSFEELSENASNEVQNQIKKIMEEKEERWNKEHSENQLIETKNVETEK